VTELLIRTSLLTVVYTCTLRVDGSVRGIVSCKHVAIAKAGTVFNLSVCMCVSASQTVVLEACLLPRTVWAVCSKNFGQKFEGLLWERASWYEKLVFFRPISRFVSKTVQDAAIVPMEDE